MKKLKLALVVGLSTIALSQDGVFAQTAPGGPVTTQTTDENRVSYLPLLGLLGLLGLMGLRRRNEHQYTTSDRR